MQLPRLPPDLERLDQLSREQWRQIIFEVYTQAWTPERFVQIARAGRDAWLHVGGRELREQDLRQSDILWLYEQIVSRAQAIERHQARLHA